MKKIITFSFIVLFAVACSISIAKFDKTNEHKGDVILKIEHDSVGSIDSYTFFVRDSLNNIDKLIIDPDYAQFYSVGDTL
ncbi:MAG: hypothetical protein WC333_00420 [Dehalococcoidia bacterium]|jgi:hypothetical protein